MRVIYTIVGLILTVIGGIGIFLPILPTTPLLLLAAACFAKGSKRINEYFIQTDLYKNHLDSFVEKRQMKLSSKIKICSFATTFMLIGFFMMTNIYGRSAIIIALCIKYYYFIFKIETI